MYISVNHIQTARHDILKLAVEKEWSLTRFSVNKASLEDMFMKVVNQ